MLTSPSIRTQIDLLTSLGNQSLSQAVSTGNYSDYAKAIQEFSSAYKFALLLNARDGTQERCCFNLGAANIAGGDTERGIALLETILEFPNYRIEDAEKDFNTYKGDVYFNLGVGHEKLQHGEKAVESFNAALLQYNRQDNSKRTCEAYLKIANIHNGKQDFAEARRNYQNASNIYWKANEIGNSLMARICEANAAYKDKTFNRNEIVKLLDSVSKDYSQVKSKNFQGKIMCETGLLYSMLGHYDSALYCFNESIKLCNRVANLQRLAIALQNAGSILNRLGYYQEAIPKHFQAARLHGFLRNRNAQGQSFCNLALAQNELGQPDDAWEAFLHALKAFEDTDDKNGQWKCHERLGILAFNQRRSVKATRHFKAALAYLPVGTDDESRERIAYGLSEALKSQHTKSIMPKQPMPKQPIEKSTSSAHVATAETGPPVVVVSADAVDGALVKEARRARPKKRKPLDRGRRDYSDENDRPVQHVARGISNLTDYTNSIYSLKGYVPDSESTGSDSDDSLSDSNRLTIRSISADGSVADQRQFMKRRTRQKELRKLIQTTTLPINSVASMQSGEQSPRRDESDDGNAFDDTGNLKQFYKHQLGKIREGSSENDDLTDVTDTSSESSSSGDDTPQTTTSSKSTEDGKGKSRDANDTLPSLPISNDATIESTQSLDNTHLYARVRRGSQPVAGIEPPKSSVEHRNSANVVVPDGNSSTTETDGQSSASSVVEIRTESPDVPELPPRTHQSEKGRMKDKKSKMCIVM